MFGFKNCHIKERSGNPAFGLDLSNFQVDLLLIRVTSSLQLVNFSFSRLSDSRIGSRAGAGDNGNRVC